MRTCSRRKLRSVAELGLSRGSVLFVDASRRKQSQNSIGGRARCFRMSGPVRAFHTWITLHVHLEGGPSQLLHPVAAVNLVRESDRCSSPFPLLTSAIHWRIVTGGCTSSATNHPVFHPHQVAHLHPSNGTGRQSSGTWVIPVQSAFRQMRQQHDNTA